jgi:DNA-binding Lrp family transcriptional regulator
MTQTHLQVLSCLREDARMSISDISRQTGLTKRSVSRVIQEFQGQTKTQIETLVGKQNGTEIAKLKPALYFRIYWDLNAGGGFTLVARVKWDVGKGKPEEIVKYFQKHFPLEFWFAFAAATEPVLYSVFVVDHVRTAEKLLPKIKKVPHKSSLEIWISYPMRKFIGLRESLIDEMLENAGF